MRENFKKDVIIDYTKEEFLEKYQIKENFFKDSIKNFLNHYDIQRESLKRSATANGTYEIQYDIADILAILLKNFKNSPFYDNRNNIKNKTMEDINSYNKKIIEEIDKLPEYMQFYIKRDDDYELNFVLVQLMPVLIDKLTILFKTAILKSNRNIGSTLGMLIEYVEILIDEHCKEDLIEKWSDENLGQDSQESKKKSKNYNIDFILAKTFNEFYREYFSKLDKNISEEVKSTLDELKNSDEDIHQIEIERIRGLYKNEINKISIDEKEFEKINNNIEKYKINIVECTKIHKIPNKDIYGDKKEHQEYLEKLLIKLYKVYKLSNKVPYRQYHVNLAPFILKTSYEVKKYRYKYIKDNLNKYVGEEIKNSMKLEDKINSLFDDAEKFNVNPEEMCSVELKKFIMEISKEIEKYKIQLIKKCAKEIIELEEEAYSLRCKLFKEIDKDYGYEIKRTFNIAFGQILINIMSKEKIKK